VNVLFSTSVVLSNSGEFPSEPGRSCWKSCLKQQQMSKRQDRSCRVELDLEYDDYAEAKEDGEEHERSLE
jgi:hypothetical protein